MYMLYLVQQGLAVNGEFPSLPCRQDSLVIWGVAGHSARRQLSGAAPEAGACVVDDTAISLAPPAPVKAISGSMAVRWIKIA
jgi:hypothetical protein